jgi:hypothetical protein
MSLYATTDEQKVELYTIAAAMSQSGLPASFIAEAVELASESEGIFDLVALWAEADGDQGTRDALVADLQEAIDEAAERPQRAVEKPKISYGQLDSVAAKVVAFKAELRQKVDQWGGISKLAAATGMPQPSLSRFFNSASMPRRTTLYRIARALGLGEEDIATDWIA